MTVRCPVGFRSSRSIKQTGSDISLKEVNTNQGAEVESWHGSTSKHVLKGLCWVYIRDWHWVCKAVWFWKHLFKFKTSPKDAVEKMFATRKSCPGFQLWQSARLAVIYLFTIFSLCHICPTSGQDVRPELSGLKLQFGKWLGLPRCWSANYY